MNEMNSVVLLAGAAQVSFPLVNADNVRQRLLYRSLARAAIVTVL